jgi:hypothetical protein
VDGHVAHLLEVDVSHWREAPGELQPVVEVVDDDDAARAHQPGRLGGEEPTGPAPNTTTVSPSSMSPISAPEVAGRARVGQQHGVVVVHPVGISVGPTSANGTRTYSAWPPS